ncbi:MAG: hypothetical protein H7Z75_20375, partial [Ferruginibacter sp.]|nr:hypothetical protein [Cytophagales bacterium]
MPRIVAATFILCWCAFPCHSQNYMIDINQGAIRLANRHFYVERVIDARLEMANVGTVQTGVLN